MGKIKTHKASAKRFDVTGSGKVKMNHSHHRHNLGIKTAKPAKEVVTACMDQGVLVLTAKDKVRLLPALNIPMAQLQKAVAVIKAACK